mmetsp:Transcript_33883/g.95988  ORF Transcript_33883/g.95988 Transcript_33883/m.95988 type:complete len:293 (-) Transcript_33883:416-1294(-)
MGFAVTHAATIRSQLGLLLLKPSTAYGPGPSPLGRQLLAVVPLQNRPQLNEVSPWVAPLRSRTPWICRAESKEREVKSNPTADEVLKALCGDLFDEFHVEPAEMVSSVDDRDEATLPKELFKVSRSCPISSVMGTNVITCSPDDIIKDMVELFSDRTGVPVVKADRTVVGMITRKDIMRLKKHHASLKQRVGDHMSSPAITVRNTAKAMEVARVMLQSSVHRVPVVDAYGRLVGVASRSDLFSQLTGSDIESDKMSRLAGDEDLMGSSYWKDLHSMHTVDLDEHEQEYKAQN